MGTKYKLLNVDVDIVPVIKTHRPNDYHHPQLTAHISEGTLSNLHTINIAGIKCEFSNEELNAAYINKLNKITSLGKITTTCHNNARISQSGHGQLLSLI